MALPVRINRGRAIDPVDLVRNDFNTMLGHLFGGRPFDDASDFGALAPMSNYGVDIREDADHVYVIADLPGFRKEDVDISLEDGTLTITAERREEITVPPPEGQPSQQDGRRRGQPAQGQSAQGQSAQGGQAGQGQAGQSQLTPEVQRSSAGDQGEYLLRERRVQRFIRSFTLPPNVDDEHVEARLENGVLTITLNKREESKPRRVQVS
jgi:HSP20 family molecular chaperone IbpA